MTNSSSSRFLLGQLVAGQKAMNEKLDDLVKTSRKADDDQVAASAALDERITSLEASRYKTVGAAGVISVLFGIVSTWWSNH